jgi:hypothetical protein
MHWKGRGKRSLPKRKKYVVISYKAEENDEVRTADLGIMTRTSRSQASALTRRPRRKETLPGNENESRKRERKVDS